MRLVFAGTPAPAVPSLLALLSSRHDVAAVITRPDTVAGRGRRPTLSPVKEAAVEAGLEVLQPRRVRDPDFLDRLRAIGPDCCPVVAFGALIPPDALAIPRRGWVNLHFSLLPAWRGAAPVQRAVMAGDEITGASTFLLEEGLDTGPIYGVITEPIGPRDTSGDLLDRLAVSGAGLLVATLDGIEDGTVVARPQPDEGVSLAPKVEVDDVRVAWDGTRGAGRPPDPGGDAGPGRLDHVPRPAAQGRTGPAPGRDGPAGRVPAGPRPLRCRRRHRFHGGAARWRTSGGQGGDAGRGVGPRGAPAGRRSVRVNTVAGRRQPPEPTCPACSPGDCFGPSTSGRPTRTWCCRS